MPNRAHDLFQPQFRFGMGGVSVGNEFNKHTDKEAQETLEAAWAIGVRYFDVAPWYGYPQSGERICGQQNIRASRMAQPNAKRFIIRRIIGVGDLWVTEYVLVYDGRPSYVVSIMEFTAGKVRRETQYFSDAFEPGPSRRQWVEKM